MSTDYDNVKVLLGDPIILCIVDPEDYNSDAELKNQMRHEFDHFFHKVTNLQHVVKGCVFGFGSVVNILLLLMIVLDNGMRESLRNKLICNLFVVYLLKCVSEIPKIIEKRYSSHIASCEESSKAAAEDFLEDNVENMIFVLLFVVYLVRAFRLDIHQMLGPCVVKVGVVFLMIGPWCFALMLMLINIPHHGEKRMNYTIFSYHCFSLEFYKGMNIVDIVLFVIAVLLMGVSLGWKCWMFVRDRRSSEVDRTEKSGDNMADPILAYVLAVVMLMLFQFPYHVMPLLPDVLHTIQETRTVAYVWISLELVNDSRHVFMPFVWILLPDIRQRIRSLIPRCYFFRALDLTPLFGKNKAEVINSDPMSADNQSGFVATISSGNERYDSSKVPIQESQPQTTNKVSFPERFV